MSWYGPWFGPWFGSWFADSSVAPVPPDVVSLPITVTARPYELTVAARLVDPVILAARPVDPITVRVRTCLP